MRLLFFDIECCDGQHICEFGYVIADENFEVLEKEHFLMDPQWRFNLGKRGCERIKLGYSQQQYRESLPFTHFYKRIKAILEAQQTAIGFSVRDDVKYLDVACERYHLKKYAFQTVDSQYIFANLYNEGRRTSLEKAAEALSLPIDVTLHKSDDDALLTLRIVETMCKDKGLSVQELLERSLAEEKRIRAKRKAARSHVESTPCTIGDILADKASADGFKETISDTVTTG